MWPAPCRPGYGRPAVPRPQKAWSGENGRAPKLLRLPSKHGPISVKKLAIGSARQLGEDHAAWALCPLQIGRVFAHRHPGRRARGINTQAAIFESWSCARCLFGVSGFISDLIHERSVAIVSRLRLSVLFDSVKSKLSELVAAQAIAPI